MKVAGRDGSWWDERVEPADDPAHVVFIVTHPDGRVFRYLIARDPIAI